MERGAPTVLIVTKENLTEDRQSQLDSTELEPNTTQQPKETYTNNYHRIRYNELGRDSQNLFFPVRGLYGGSPTS